MSITGIVAGIWMSVSGTGDGDISAGDVLQGARTIYAIQQKTEIGTWDDSWHEESHQIVKDTMREIRYGQ